MSEYTNELIRIGYFIGLSFILAFILLGAVYVISFTSKVDFEKSSAYECGFQPFSETTFPFEVQFALIGILFLLFDIEILYLYPLCTSILQFNSFEILYLIIFFVIVTLGLVYEISRNIVYFFSYDEFDPSFANSTRNQDLRLRFSYRFGGQYLCVLFLSILINFILSDDSNNVSYTSISTDVAITTQNMEEFVNSLSLEELSIFNDNLGFNQRDYMIWHDLDNVNTVRIIEPYPPRSFGWDSLALFIVGTIILYGIARYDDSILSTFYDFGIGNVNGLIQFAQQAGQVPQVRTFLIDQTQNVLNNPDTAPRVCNAMRQVNEFRQQV